MKYRKFTSSLYDTVKNNHSEFAFNNFKVKTVELKHRHVFRKFYDLIYAKLTVIDESC